MHNRASSLPSGRSALLLVAPALLLAFAYGLAMALLDPATLMERVQDDAFYYIIIARNIIEHGQSAFTPGISTNGYHPLWMIVLIAVGSICGLSLLTVKLTETVLVAVGLIGALRLLKVRTIGEAVLATAILWLSLHRAALNGMETALLVPGFVLWIWVLVSRSPLLERRRVLALIGSAALVIGARLDAAVFVLPMLALAPVSIRDKIAAVAGIAVLGGIYAAFNLWAFGSALPVSGLIKSLGATHWNTLYWAQLTGQVVPAIIPIAINALALSVGYARRNSSDNANIAWRLTVAATIGTALYQAKLLFGSSWIIWAWYRYPLILFVLLLLYQWREWKDQIKPTSVRPAFLECSMKASGLLLVIAISVLDMARPTPSWMQFSRIFAERNEALFGKQMVAMGDRAGGFAYSYGGSVFQLEGLVNDPAYAKILKQGGDMTQYLCARGIGVLVDFEPELTKGYGLRTIPIFRPELTSAPSPTITVRESDQLAALGVEDVEPNPIARQHYRLKGDNNLYAWKLHCAP